VPKGLKPVRKRLASGEIRLYWYHRAAGKALKHDPETAEGLLEVAELDRRAAVGMAMGAALAGSYATLWAKYRESAEWRRLRPRTRSDYQAVRDWLGEAAERGSASSLSAEAIKGLRDKAADERGRRFGNYVLQVIRLTLEWGKERGLCRVNPAMGLKTIRRPTGSRKVNRAWLPAEIEAFATGAPAQLLVPFALGLFAGMRQGDALRVTWSAYDGEALRWIASKNGEACMAPATGVLKAVLDDAKARRGAAVQIAVSSAGTPWSQSGFRASFFKRLRALRDDGAVQPGCTFHGLRHTIVTLGRNAGESDFRLAAGIGDRTTAMSAVYGRDADREAAQVAVLSDMQKRFENAEWKPKAR